MYVAGRLGLISGNSTKIQDVFSITADTAANLDALSTTGWDLLIGKSRVNTNSWIWRDSARGLSNTLASDSTAAQGSFITYAGGLGSGNALLLRFKQISKFCCAVAYTGTGDSDFGRTVAHPLGIAPGFILIKKTSASDMWNVLARDGAGTKSVWILSGGLQATNAALSTASTSYESTFNSTTFTPAIVNNGNTISVNYIAYLFAHDPDTTNGLIQCFGFTTDGSGNASVTLGWEPQCVLFKATTTTGNWIFLDQSRLWWSSGADYTLAMNTTAGDGVTDYGTPTSTGITFSGLSASQSYIGMAIRKGPMT